MTHFSTYADLNSNEKIFQCFCSLPSTCTPPKIPTDQSTDTQIDRLARVCLYKCQYTFSGFKRSTNIHPTSILDQDVQHYLSMSIFIQHCFLRGRQILGFHFFELVWIDETWNIGIPSFLTSAARTSLSQNRQTSSPAGCLS